MTSDVNESLYDEDIKGIKKLKDEGKTLDEVIEWIKKRWGSSIPKETIEEAIEVYDGTWIDWTAAWWNEKMSEKLTEREKEVLTELVEMELEKVTGGLPKAGDVICVAPELLKRINKLAEYKRELEQLLTKMRSD